MEIKERSSVVNQEGSLLSLREEALATLNRDRLKAELEKALADLGDLEELRQGFLGQTGVHIGIRVLKSARCQFEQEETKIRERIAFLEKLLNKDESGSSEKP